MADDSDKHEKDAAFNQDADNLRVMNDPLIEAAWMRRTIDHMEIYFNLLCAVPPTLLRLTAFDQEIYDNFRSDFPDFDVGVLDIPSLKSEDAKIKWRAFCQQFIEKVEDASFATMVRIDSKKDYSEENSILVLRLQFLAIEIARNREGFNDSIRLIYPKSNRSKEGKS